MARIEMSKQTLVRNLARFDIDTDDIYENYTGRGMSRPCLGYQGAGPTAFALALAITVSESEYGSADTDLDTVSEALMDLGEPRRDQLGLGTIAYWPAIALVDDEVNEEEQD